jgi:hypothetical protein
MAQQALAYQYNPDGASGSVPAAAAVAQGGYMGPDGKWVHAPKPGKKASQGKRETVIRNKGGRVWEDQTLLEWDPCKPASLERPWLSNVTTDSNYEQLGSGYSWGIFRTMLMTTRSTMRLQNTQAI